MSREDPQPTKDSTSDDPSEGSVSIVDEGTSSNKDTTTTVDPSEGDRDEIEEIRKQSRVETARVRTWRILVTVALFITAIVVTATTYKLLIKQEDKNFRNVYEQFARTVADAAIDQQAVLRQALAQFEDTIVLASKMEGDNWPYFIPPMYETLAADFKKVANVEFISVNNFVTHEQRDSYIDYITPRYEDFIQEAHMLAYGRLDNLDTNTSFYQPFIAKKVDGKFVPDHERDHYFCRTVQSPPARKYGPTINNNLIADKTIGDGFAAVMKLHNESVITSIKPFANVPIEEHRKMHPNGGVDNPHSFTFSPIHREIGNPDSEIVAMFALATAWDVSMLNLLPDNVKGMICVIENTCDQIVSYRIDGKDALYLGEGDFHRPEYDDMAVFVDLNLQTHPLARSTPGHCMYSMKIYPSKAFEEDYKTKTPLIFALVVAVTFVMVAGVYMTYDIMVHKRNEKMIQNAARSNAIVTSFIPEHLRDRIMEDKAAPVSHKSKKGNLKTYLSDTKHANDLDKNSKPLADLFLETTVLFADIAGFTAWSSVREPSSVFTLLETLYQAFDSAAKKRGVFKVETVGDCYVAVCGLPQPRRDHAVVMARFANDILSTMRVLTKRLEVTLGPDTGDLCLRIGIHSGPVTAGILRGERSRFQLFGDTMNTASRIEASGKRDRVQCSAETAALLIDSGKEHWLKKRADVVSLKGKGTMDTYWVNVNQDRSGSAGTASNNSASGDFVDLQSFGQAMSGIDEKTERLIDWNVQMLLGILKKVVASRSGSAQNSKSLRTSSHHRAKYTVDQNLVPLDEVREIIELPEFDAAATRKHQDPDSVEIPKQVLSELHGLVSGIAAMYRNNPFHNFSHASHVVMSVIKLMSRIVAPSDMELDQDKKLHDNSYGITSDPLTQFACAFSALIHDVDHTGVSNAQLIKENNPLCAAYKHKSIAEQNSVDLAWNLLMADDYASLRDLLFPTAKDLSRFRQLVVNSVLATDIIDKDLKDLRNARWEKAFDKDDVNVEQDGRDAVNRKATIVIEHIIQASDISHCCQHWHVYRKWNRHLFEELYVAYLNGRMEKDPSDFWYKGEFGFFDFYIIPLTKKLKDCGVFGVSSDELLNYARKNREEWEAKGQEVVAEMVEECRKKYGVNVKGS